MRVTSNVLVVCLSQRTCSINTGSNPVQFLVDLQRWYQGESYSEHERDTYGLYLFQGNNEKKRCGRYLTSNNN
jgi:hypothetical protein